MISYELHLPHNPAERTYYGGPIKQYIYIEIRVKIFTFFACETIKTIRKRYFYSVVVFGNGGRGNNFDIFSLMAVVYFVLSIILLVYVYA